MLIIRLKGGLGNQMFQYAFGRALAEKRNEPLFLDTSIFGNEPKRDTPRHYSLDCFNIKALLADPLLTARFNTKTAILLRKIKRRVLRLNDFTYHPSLAHSKSQFMEGFWNNEKYFRGISDLIRHEFTLKKGLGATAEKIASDIIKSKNSSEKKQTVSVHVRRGDYVSNQYSMSELNILGLEYYQKALDHISEKLGKENIEVHIFSDDIEWVKENLILPGYSITYVAHTQFDQVHDYEEMHLMSLCDHNVIANSTFSWWGAWLNRNPKKIVIAPIKWIVNPYINTKDVCPPDWTRI